MTSVKYYSRWLREAGRGHVTAGLTWGSFFVYAVITILELGADYENHFSGIGNSSLLYLCIGLGSAAAAWGYFYLLQPVKLDFYYSLPVKKSTIFWCRYLHGLFHFFLALVSAVICCVVYQCMIDTKFQAYAASYAVRSIVSALAVFLIFYHIVIFVFTAGGRMFSVLFLFGIINVFGRAVLQGICKTYAEQFFVSYYCIPVFGSFEAVLSPRDLSGLLLGEDIFVKQEALEYVPGGACLLAAFLWILLFFILSVYFQKRRKQEYVGNAFLFSAVEKGVVFLTSVCLPLYLGGFFLKIFYEKGEGRSLAVLILAGSGVVLVILAHCLMRRLIRRNDKGMIGNRRQLLAEGALALFICIGFAASAPYFDGFLPEKDEVASIDICMNGLHMTQQEAASNQYGKRDYGTDERLETYRLTEEGLTEALVWLRSLREHDIKVKKRVTFVTVCYHMKTGGERYRVYPVSETGLLAFSSVYESREYKEKAYEVLEWGEVKDNRLLWSDGASSQVLELSGEEKEELIRLYKKEILELKMEMLREAPPSGIVEMRSERWGEQTKLFIYPFLTDTCEFLSSHGVKVMTDLFDYSVSSFKVFSEEPAAQGALSFPAPKSYESEEEFKEFKGRFIWAELDVQPLLYPFDYSKRAEAEVKEPGSGALIKVKYFALFRDNNYDMMKNNAAIRK